MPDQRKLGDYILDRTLGEGGFSKVKLGIHEQTGQRVAVKILKKNLAEMTPQQKQCIEREIETMAKIQHKNIVNLIKIDWNAEYTKKDGKKMKVIVMFLELAEGGELFEFLAFTGCFEEAIARAYFRQLVEGLSAMHNNGVVHRDLKPENLLLDQDFSLKIADFGFSNMFEKVDPIMYTECGTPGYMAPEMFKNKGYDGQKVDIWSIGVVLFIMLTGFPPFQKPDNSDWWFNKLANNKHALFWQAHSRNAYFSADTKDFINKILCPDKDKRITLEGIKRHPWYNGPTIDDSALVNEMSRRKAEVGIQKAREQAEAKRLKAEAAAARAAAAGGINNNYTFRGLFDSIEADSDDMPPMSPDFSCFVKFEPNAQAAQAVANAMAAPMPAAVPDKKYTPPMYDEKTALACYTKFKSSAAPDDVLGQIDSLLTRYGAKVDVVDESFMVHSTVDTGSEKVAFVAQVFSTQKPNETLVEFRKMNGQHATYQNLFYQMVDALDQLVLKE